MADFQKIKQDIKDEIRPNGIGSITGKVMQDILVEVVETAEELFEEQGKAIDTANEEITKTKNSVQENSAEITKANEEITKTKNELSKKANDNDYYPKMSVGFADNLVGREVATPEQFTYRASAGERSIGDEGARIKRIKGNTVVWSQLLNVANAVALTPASATVTVVGNSITVTSKVSASAGDNVSVKIPNVVVPVGHKVLLAYEMTTKALGITKCHTEGIVESYSSPSFKDITATSTHLFLKADGVVEVGDSWTFSNIHLFDLTQMFTSDDKIETVADFYARIPSGIDINAYNEGEIISMHTEAIKTVGFNQWDEQWEVGGLNQNNGSNYDSQKDRIRSKNYTKVMPDTEYCFTVPSSYGFYLYMYDEDKNFIRYQELYSSVNTFKIPSDISWIRFYIAPGYGTTYNHDICINISHTGWKNGTYSPYRTFTRQLPDLGVMRGAGNAFDEIRFNVDTQKWEKVTRIGEVDLGSLNWAYNATRQYFKSVSLKGQFTFLGAQKINNLISAKYITVTGNQIYNGLVPEGIAFEDVTAITVKDATYTDATSFKSAMQGVMLYYELAEPIIEELDWSADTNLDYAVEDFGTEEAISSVPSAPFSADIIYPFNAVDTIRQNEREIQALKTAIQQMSEAMSINREE